MVAPEWLWPVVAAPFIGSFLGVLVMVRSEPVA